MYEALSHSPNKFDGHKVRLNIYRKSSPPKDGIFKFKSKFHGMVRQEDEKWKSTNDFSIGYTEWGDKGPILLLLHGAFSNRRIKLPIQELLSPFCRTIAIDILGMGGEGTSIPQYYGDEEGMSIYQGKEDDSTAWDWIHDCDYIHDFMISKYPDEKFFFSGDDWGGGILSHYIDKFPKDLLGAIWISPVSFDGYPVSEIQAFGRAAMIPREDQLDDKGVPILGMDDMLFKNFLSSSDQMMNVIFKQMIFNFSKYNQYNLREMKCSYIDTDYERARWKEGEDANSLTLRLKYDNIRTFCERAAILSPALLLPYDEKKNPKGVDFTKFRGNAQVIWGDEDTMNPSNQKWRFKAVLTNVKSLDIVSISNAGHFVETDQPEKVAEAMFNFMSNIVGINKMGDICLGFQGIWKGDEREMIKDLRQLWNLGLNE